MTRRVRRLKEIEAVEIGYKNQLNCHLQCHHLIFKVREDIKRYMLSRSNRANVMLMNCRKLMKLIRLRDQKVKNNNNHPII